MVIAGVAAAARSTAEQQHDKVGTGGRQTDMQAGNCHQVTAASSRITLPLFSRNQMACSNDDRGKHRNLLRVIYQFGDPADKTHADALCKVKGACSEQAVARPVDHISHCAYVLAKKPRFIVKTTGVTIPARTPQPHFQLPDITIANHELRIKPAQSDFRRQARVIEGVCQKTNRLGIDGRESDDLNSGNNTVASDIRRNTGVDQLLRRHEVQQYPDHKPKQQPPLPQ